MAEQLGEARLKLSVDGTALEAGLQRAKTQAEQTGQAIGQTFTKSGRELQTAANGLQYYIDAQGRARDASGKFVTSLQLQEAGLRGAGTAAAGAASNLRELAIQLGALEAGRRAVGFIVEQLKQLDAGQAAVRTLGVDSEKLTSKLRDLSAELGASVSVNDLLKASYDVLSSGFTSATDSVNILRAAALGAQGGFAKTDDVVRALTGVLNAYGLSSSQALKVTDSFLQTQNDGVITVAQYAAEIGNVASIAAASGVSIQQLNAAIATATLRGVPVAQTFTGIRQALSNIIKPSNEAAQLARSLGIQFNVAALQSKGLAGVLADVQEKTGGSADKIAILLGSVEAQAAIQPLLNDKLAKYNELLAKQSESAGAAAAASKTNAATISGSIAQIGNSFSNLATTLDSSLNPVFGTLARNLSTVLGDLTKILNLIPKGAGNVQGALTASLLLGPGVGIEALRGSFSGGSKPKLTGQTPPRPPRATNTGAAPTPVDPNVAISQRIADFGGQQALQAIRERLLAAQQKTSLDEVSRASLESQLAINEKIRAVEADRLALKEEQSKRPGVGDSKDGTQSFAKIAELQAKIKTGQEEINLARLQGQQAETDAFRQQQDRYRGYELENAAASDKLRIVGQQIALEQQAGLRGQEVTASAQLELQIRERIAAALRQQLAARQALQAEQRRAMPDRMQLETLFQNVYKANASVAQTYAEAGKELEKNANSAKQTLQGLLRSNYDVLTPQLQRDQITRARAAIQPLVDNGTIRQGIDISTPEKLFQVAGIAEQLGSAQANYKQALDLNTKAVEKNTLKDTSVYLQLPGQSAPIPLPRV